MFKYFIIILFLSFSYSQSFGYSNTTITTLQDPAQIFVNGIYVGDSPITIQVQDGLHAKANNVCAEKDGFNRTCITLDQEWNYAIAGLAGCCSLFFLPAAGAVLFAVKHKPTYVFSLQQSE